MEDLTKVDFSFKQFFLPLTILKAINIIFIVGFIVYFNVLFNGFVGDDKRLILENAQAHQVNLPLSFGPSSFNQAGQFRPIPATYFSLLYVLFGNTSFFYHFFELLLHILCGVLLYLFSRKFFSPGIALLLSVIFLVHPINEEVAAHITDLQDVLYMFFGLLLLLVSTKKSLSRKDLMIIFPLLLLSLLTKETGILFFFITLIYCFLFARKNLVNLSIGAFLAFVVYLFFRFFIGHVDLSVRTAPIMHLTFTSRLLNMPAIVFYYLKMLFFPKSIAYQQQWVITSIDFQHFYFPLMADVLFFTLIGLAGFYIVKRHKDNSKPFLFYSAWFILGLFFHLQIYPLDATVADRWMYFPIVGLLGILGVGIHAVQLKSSKVKNTLLVAAVALIGILSMRTMVRNTNWYDEIALLTHDVQVDDTPARELTLGSMLVAKGMKDQALPHFVKAIELKGDLWLKICPSRQMVSSTTCVTAKDAVRESFGSWAVDNQ